VVLGLSGPVAYGGTVGPPKGPAHRDPPVLPGRRNAQRRPPLARRGGRPGWKGIARGRPFGLEGRGRPIEFSLLRVIHFTEDGRMAREQVWVDLAAIQQQLPG
jgi:hypothetical protein